jgi:protein-arginine kinase activator protein McsA
MSAQGRAPVSGITGTREGINEGSNGTVACDSCGIKFQPLRSDHRLCRQCWHHKRFAAAIRAQVAFWRAAK